MLDRLTIGRMAALAEARPIAVAVSGGGDSLALAHLLAAEFGAARLRAFVVDHSLREGSRADAEAALRSVEDAGVAAGLLTLDWAGAPRKSQAAARRARYRALAVAARRAGANLIALGHTADDQAETVLMRAAAGSGWRGLAGMAAIAPAPVWPEGEGVLIARPLLGARRAGLRELLNARGVRWLEDPANANLAFERVRARTRLGDLASQGFDPMRLAELARRMRDHADGVDAAALALIAGAARFEGPRILIDVGEWRGDGEARRRALAVLLAAAAGRDRGPAPDAVERLESRMKKAGFRGASLGGARVRPARAGLSIDRDPGALLGRAGGPAPLAPVALPAGERLVWDGRTALVARSPGWIAGPGADGGLVLRREDAPEAAADVDVEWLLEPHARHLLSGR